MELRPYQKECLNTIEMSGSGSFIVRMATGLGKTTVFTHLPRKGKTLVLAHRKELVHQPIKYYNCPVGVEMANEFSHGEEVVIASVQSLTRRLKRFSHNEFDTIITDECHHSAAHTYREIYDYFQPRCHLGFTATMRGDGVRLDNIYSDIIFDRDLKWGIKNGYLCDIYCLRANIGYDISNVATRMGDYAPGELGKAMNQDSLNDGIAEAYRKYAKGATLIFASSVECAEEIAKRIPGAVAVTAETKDRQSIIDAFTRREIPCLVNCMIFTEGTDIPLIETIIIARPTKNSSLYTQMVGRGLRLYPGKDKLTLIDCVGVTSKADLCTAPSLLGIDIESVPQDKQKEIEGDLFELPELVGKATDCPQSWIRNVQLVDLWARKQKYNTHHLNFFKMPNGDMVLTLPKQKYVIPAQDELGYTRIQGQKVPMQKAIDSLFCFLRDNRAEEKQLWDLSIAKRWGAYSATQKQKAMISRIVKGFDPSHLTKLEASQILNRVFCHGH